jgi:hypothetical protein
MCIFFSLFTGLSFWLTGNFFRIISYNSLQEMLSYL